MQQIHDFHAESMALADLLSALPEAKWQMATQFKAWTINDVIVHLHFWNRAADLSLRDPSAFDDLMAKALPAFQASGMRAFENAEITERGPALYALWKNTVDDMLDRWRRVDPKARLKWAGPDMSARSMITARQMETWAHGQEVFDVLGHVQPQEDRIRNVVVLGVNTFGWSHQVHGRAIPEQIPELRLRAPSGEIWSYGDAGSGNVIEGNAVDFAQVVTQTRNVADTDLRVQGEIAATWMAIAQCFAGPPETPPAKGARFRASV